MIRFDRKRALVQCITFLVISLFFLSSFLQITQISIAAQTGTDLAEIRVGIYNGEPVQSGSATALTHMFEWMESTVVLIDAEAIRNGTLDSIDLVVFGGGSPNNFALDIGIVGIEQLKQFVAGGGSYFGICGGGMFASDYLELCVGSWSAHIPGMAGGAYLAELSVNRASTGPDLSNEPESYYVYFSDSIFFAPANPASIIRIMSYPANDEAAMFVSRYGSGTLFASGPHAEYEEGSNRDGLTTYDFLNDPDSEWDILEKVTQWLIDEAGTTSNPDPFAGVGAIILGVSLLTLIVIFSVAFYFKRK